MTDQFPNSILYMVLQCTSNFVCFQLKTDWAHKIEKVIKN